MERHLASASSARSKLGTNGQGNPTPHELRAFLLLAEDLHFGRAAARLGLAQSSLSETIRRLEAKLDAVLLERTSRRVELTEAGDALLPVARQALDALAAVQAVAAGATPSPVADRPFRIGIEVPGLLELNRPIMSAFRARHPDLPIALKEFSCAHGFFEHRLDVALVRTPIHDERIEVRPVATEARVVLLPPGHPAADADGLTLHDLEDEPFVALDASAARDYWLARDLRDGELPRIGARAFTAAEIFNGVAHLGCVFVGLESARLSGGLPAVDAVGVPDNVIGVATRTGDARPPVLAFAEIVARVVAEQAHLAPAIRPLEDAAAPALAGAAR